MPGTITPDGDPLVWIAKYWRHYGRYEEEFGSLEEAVRFLEAGEDYGDLSSDSIVGPDGGVVFDFSGPLNIWEVAERLGGEARTGVAAPVVLAAPDPPPPSELVP